MKIYLAGYYNGKASAYDIKDYDYFLESYHYINTARHCAAIREDGRSVFLDSGAFSAFTQGAVIEPVDYADFITRNKDIIHVASNLDIIGAGNEQGSYDNLKRLESLGAKVQPVHHARDADHWLQRYMDEGYDYIFLGGMVPESTPYLKEWLDRLWTRYLVDSNGLPKIKVHGFGLTRLDLIHRYPWYSVDSTSWVMTGRFGGIFVEIDGRHTKIMISNESPRMRDLDAHYDTLPPLVKERVTKIITEAGFDPEELRSIYWKRDIWNIAYFKRLCDQPVRPFKHYANTLF